ncbi:MAG: multidrug transporter, partial [Proteobacteria bacterium]
MMIYYVVLGIGILAGIAGQMLLKAGADAPTLVAQVMRPSTLVGLGLYGSAAFLYIFA